MLPGRADLWEDSDVTYFPLVGRFSPKGRELRLGVLVWESQGCELAGLGKGSQTDVTVLEGRGRPDA